ncbi:MAG: hypothetical protein Q7U37_03440 [Gallionella sp.]|nr:hypothetical protein [Gallionella sp.]MDP1939866.1 hypothetical protein [Gallionella sp.]
MSLPVNRNDTWLQIVFWCLTLVGTNCANSATVNAQNLDSRKVSEQLCHSISGTYRYVGETSGEIDGVSLIGVMFGKPLIKGEPMETELIHNVENSTLRIKVYGKDVEPVPDFSINIGCVAGVLVYEYSERGHGDGSTYDMKSTFRFSKDNTGALVVHKIYSVKSTNLLFFKSKSRGEAIIRFLPF